jgi:hypothetical protein
MNKKTDAGSGTAMVSIRKVWNTETELSKSRLHKGLAPILETKYLMEDY